MGKGGSPPPAPDYAAQAKQQGLDNIEAARVGATLNNPNVVSPYGTQTFTHGSGFNQAGYDTAQSDYQAQLQRYLAAGGDAQQQTLSGGGVVNSGMSGRGGGGGGFFGGVRPNPNYIAKPARPNEKDYLLGNQDQATLTQVFSPEQQALYDQQVRSQQLLGGLGQQGINAAQGIIGRRVDYAGAPAMPGNSDAIRQKVYDAMMQRPNEDLAVQRDNANSQMVAAGLRPGTPAYDHAMRQIDRQENDARNQAVMSGGVEAQRNYGMDLQLRQQGLNEYNAQRSIPLNEITALMSGSQVSSPFSMPGVAQNANVAPAPTYAAANAAGQYGTDVFNAQQASNASTRSGLMGLGGAALGAAAIF